MLLLNVRARYAIVAIVGPSSIARPVGIARTWAALAREQGGGLCPIGQPKNIEVPLAIANTKRFSALLLVIDRINFLCLYLLLF